jgi:hypothetical protein
LRIYFAWDDELELIVVGHLPEHLTNTFSRTLRACGSTFFGKTARASQG